MKIIETKVYPFNELETEKAKDAARQWWLEDGLDNWYDRVETDAKEAGINIKEFDIDSASFIRNVQLEFIEGGNSAAEKIMHNHGVDTDTYKAAMAFEKAKDAMPELPAETHVDYAQYEREACETFDALEGDFLSALTLAYKKLLQQELDYRCSNESIDQTILANEYTFTAEGKRFG